MTLCLALTCEAASVDGAQIVAVSDQMITFEDIAADSLALKSEPIHRNWFALYASNDVGHIHFILEEIRRRIGGRSGEKSASEIAQIANASIQDRLRAEIEARVLSRNGFTVSSFRRLGRKQLTEKVFDDLSKRMNQISLESVLLLCGFDGHGEPRLIVVSDTELPRDWSSVGFAAIGSGARVSQDALVFYADKKGLNQNAALSKAVYCACGAKFMAESVRTVGSKRTFVSVFAFNQSIRYLRPLAWKEIRSEWNKVGIPEIPDTLLSKIPSMLLSAEQIRDEMQKVSGATAKTSAII